MKYLILAILIVGISSCERMPVTSAPPIKNEMWWTYLANYDGLPGSTLVDLSLRSRAPVPGYTALVVTGVNYPSVPEHSGLPDGPELDFLNLLSEKRRTVILTHSKAIFVGSFTHNNERLDYVYVTDPFRLDTALQSFYKAECPTRRPYINIKSDPNWEAYLDFLYPSPEIIEHHRSELQMIGAL